jgi:hypothetical protein
VSILRSFIPTGQQKTKVRVPSPDATHFWVKDSPLSGIIRWFLFILKCIARLIGGGHIMPYGYIMPFGYRPFPYENILRSECTKLRSAVSKFLYQLSTVHCPLSTFFPFCLHPLAFRLIITPHLTSWRLKKHPVNFNYHENRYSSLGVLLRIYPDRSQCFLSTGSWFRGFLVGVRLLIWYLYEWLSATVSSCPWLFFFLPASQPGHLWKEYRFWCRPEPRI